MVRWGAAVERRRWAFFSNLLSFTLPGFSVRVTTETMDFNLITLTTDFGTKDPFVGTMKGVILQINPRACVVDLTHGVAAQDVASGALALSSAVPFFPRSSIHVAVVDPGVGSDRRPLLIESEGSFFVGPDNGIFSLVLKAKKPGQIIALTNESFHLRPTSTTFHGRDIFAPVAAHLSLGVPPGEFGNPVEDFNRLSWPDIARTGNGIRGNIVYIDGFGNLITNIHENDLKGMRPENLTVSVRGLAIRGVASSYSCADRGAYVALINSWGLLEIARFKGNARLSCGAEKGDMVDIRETRGAQ